jgi:hypothetical protein
MKNIYVRHLQHVYPKLKRNFKNWKKLIKRFHEEYICEAVIYKMGGKKLECVWKWYVTQMGLEIQNFSHLPKRTRKQHNNNFASKICQRPTCLLRASPPVLSMWFQTVQFMVKKSKCAGLAQETGFFFTKFIGACRG